MKDPMTTQTTPNNPSTSRTIPVFDDLCEFWERAWNDLTTSRPFIKSGGRGDTLLDRSQPLALRMSALIDLPLAYRSTIDSKSAQDRILEIAKLSPHSYAPLASKEFRLLQLEQKARNMPLRLGMTNVPLLNNTRRYSAVSYCWGPLDQDEKIVFVNGKFIVISNTLYELLRCLHRWSCDFYWIDALCINQESLQEKNVQIPLMGQIYGKANNVDIDLGSSPGEGHDATALHRISCDNLCMPPDSKVLKGASKLVQHSDLMFLTGVSQLLRRPWFKRVWVVQEVTLARPDAPILHMGLSHCSWNKLVTFVQLFNNTQNNLPLNSAYGHAFMRARHSLGFSGINKLISQRQDFWSAGHPKPQPPWLLWYENAQFEATNPRDKVYGILGMAPPHLAANYPIDYKKSVAQVYLDATVSVLTTNPYMYIDMLYGLPVLSTRDEFVHDSPSWAIDFSCTEKHWAQNMCKQTWRNTQHVSVPPSVVTQFKLKDRDLIVGASIVDEIAYMVQCPTSATTFRALTDTAFMSRLDEIQKLTHVELISFMLESQRHYQSGLAASELWTRGRRAALWELILSVPWATKKSRNGAPIPPQQECTEKFEALTRDGEDPNSAFLQAEPLSEQLSHTLVSLNTRFFFVTKQGLGGFCMNGARVGDTVSVLFRDVSKFPDVPFVIRPRDDGCYSMISTAWVPENWEDLSRFQGTFHTRTLVMR